MDKQLAKKLLPLINNKEAWEALKLYLHNRKTLEQQVLAVATSELELFRSQGKLSSLVLLEQLKDKVVQELK
jgi:hypothetical protein